MNLALGVAVGSSTQVALCVVPFTVLVGILVCPEDKPMSLDFHVFASAVLLMSVLIVNVTIAKGSSNWLDGSLLVHCYLIVAATFWCMD
jgi:Ca2+:H+ antiporter